MTRLLRAIRLFFLQAEHYAHCMDATWAYEAGDWEGYVFSSKRAGEIESKIILLRLEAE